MGCAGPSPWPYRQLQDSLLCVRLADEWINSSCAVPALQLIGNSLDPSPSLLPTKASQHNLGQEGRPGPSTGDVDPEAEDLRVGVCARVQRGR